MTVQLVGLGFGSNNIFLCYRHVGKPAVLNEQQEHFWMKNNPTPFGKWVIWIHKTSVNNVVVSSESEIQTDSIEWITKTPSIINFSHTIQVKEWVIDKLARTFHSPNQHHYSLMLSSRANISVIEQTL
jgi:hypothetical protein